MIADPSLEVCVPRHLSRLWGCSAAVRQPHRVRVGTHLPTLLGLRQGQLYVAGDSDILLSRSSSGESLIFIIIVSNPSRKPEKQYKTKGDDTMKKFITDERTGLQYELVGDYYLIAGEDEPEGRPIGIWGQRHLRYIRSAAMEIVSNDLIYA